MKIEDYQRQRRDRRKQARARRARVKSYRPCQRCGRDRKVEEVIEGVCRYCRENGVIKSCGDCGREFPAPGYRSRYCADCLLARKRERNRRWRAENPEKSREASRKYDRADLERRRETQRRYRERLRKDPERYARRLETRRISDRLRRQRQGVQLRVMSEQEYLKRYGNGYGRSTTVPAEPLRKLLDAWLDSDEDIAHGHVGFEILGMHTRGRLQRETGVSERSINRLLNGQQQIAVRTADRICTALGTHIDLLYPEAL